MHTVSDYDDAAAIGRAPARFSLRHVSPRIVSAATWLAVPLGGIVIGRALLIIGLPAATALALMAAIGLTIAPLVGFRGVPLAGLLFSVPLPINKHLTYRYQYIGQADGLTIELVDIWLVCLIAQYTYLRNHGLAKPVKGINAFLWALAFILLADVISFRNSADIVLSIYGLLSDMRIALIFLMVTVMVRQGVIEERAALTGMMWSIIADGVIAGLQMALGVNFGTPANPGEGIDGAFRANGFGNATTTASYFVILLPLVIIEVARATTPSRQRFARAALSLGLLGLGVTMTRSAIGFFVIGIVPLVLYLTYVRVLRVRHMALGLLLLGALAAALSDKIAERVDEGSNNMTARVNLIGTALNMADDSPLTGQGVNNYWLKMVEYSPKLQLHTFEYLVHNKYLLTLAETGAIGLAAFIWFLLLSLICAIGLARRQPLEGIGLACALIIAILNMNMEVFASGFPLIAVFTVSAFVAARSGAAEPAQESVPA